MKSINGLALCLAALVWAYPANAQEATPALSLHQAIKTALEKSPAFGSAIDRSKAMKAATSKAGALPNPEVSVEAENIAGDGPYKDFKSAEITYGMSQLIEMPGKRAGRVAVADSGEQKSLYERDATRLDLIRDVVIAYAEVVAAEDELEILKEERDLATNVYDSVAAKVDAGKEPPIQKNKAAIELSSSTIALERAERSVQTARKLLANLMGGQTDGFIVEAGTLPAMKQPDGLAAYTARMASSPDLMIRDADVRTAQSNLSMEKAGTVPDPTVNFGVRDFREDDRQALVAGLSIPLPVFDMNRAGVRRAGHEYNAAMKDRVQAQLDSETALLQSYEAFSNAYREHQVLKETVLPGAEEAFDVARAGYNAGKFGYLEVLDAQRTLFDSRKQSTQTMLDYYRELAVIDRLIATHAISKGDKE